MSRIKYRLANFLRCIGNWFLRFSSKILPTKVDYSKGMEDEIIKDFVSSNHNNAKTDDKKIEKKQRRRKWLKKTFIIIDILLGIFVIYVVCDVIYYKIILPRQAAADDASLLEEARIHPEKAGEIAIKFKDRSCGYVDQYNHFYQEDPLGIIATECKYDHYTAYATALNIYAQYVEDSLKNNIKIFYALSNFKEEYESYLDEKIDELINHSLSKVRVDAAIGDVLSQYTLACEYERLGEIKEYRHFDNYYIETYSNVLCQDKAAYWYLQAAEQGMSDAMVKLANCYKKGFGVEQSLAKAKEWYEKAAIAGNGEGMINLGDIYRDGIMYKDGIVVGRDIALAKYWWEKASTTGWWQESENRLQKIYN